MSNTGPQASGGWIEKSNSATLGGGDGEVSRGGGAWALVTGKGRLLREGVKAEGLAPGCSDIPEGRDGVCFPELGTELRA